MPAFVSYFRLLASNSPIVLRHHAIRRDALRSFFFREHVVVDGSFDGSMGQRVRFVRVCLVNPWTIISTGNFNQIV